MHSLHQSASYFIEAAIQPVKLISTETRNLRTRPNWMFDPGAEADTVPLNETDLNIATPDTQNAATSGRTGSANVFTIFANTEPSTVVENPSPEHPADGEEATQTTTHEVCDNACL